ncbi:hypothetical protein B0H13DRAFT_1464782, partial [Mycena leptocephala]
SEVCQRAAKLATCESMDTDICRTQEKREKDEVNTMTVDDAAEDKEDPVPEITRFEAMKFARCSVSDQDIWCYEMFSQ